MKRIIAAVLVALAQQSNAQAIPIPPAPPAQNYCDLNALVRAARAVVGNEVRQDARPTRVISASQTGEDCYTLPTCAARRDAEAKVTAAAKAVEYLASIDALRAHVVACEASGYGR